MKTRRLSTAAEIMERAASAGSTAETIALYQSAALLADRAGDTATAWDARGRLVEASHDAEPVERLAAYGWMVGMGGRRTQFGGAGTVSLWNYKWVINSLPDLACVPVDLMERLLDEMARTYQEAGLGDAPVHQLRLTLANRTGRSAEAAAAFERWRSSHNMGGSDCEACRLNEEMEHHLAFSRLDEAMKAAEPIVSGKRRCASIPHATFAQLVLPLLDAGRAEESMSLHRRGYHLVRLEAAHLRGAASSLAYLAATGNTEAALNDLAPHTLFAARTRNDDRGMHLWHAAALVCRRAIRDGITVVAIRWPLGVSPDSQGADGTSDLRAAQDWFAQRAADLAGRFDRRNGNRFVSSFLARIGALVDRGLKVSLDDSR